MVRCPICLRKFKMISHSHLKYHNLTIKEYKEKFPNYPMISEEHLINLSKAQKGKKTGENNPAKRKEIREKISNSVKNRWDEGKYSERINGMTGMFGSLHPSWKKCAKKREPLYLAKNQYASFLSQYEDITICKRCGSRKKINIHHIDEDHNDFLISNLEPLCVPCHTSFHYSLQKRPFLIISKKFSFAACHRLPLYEGACHNWHGHEWALEISIKKRIDTKTGMVLDFSILKDIINKHIIEVLDHSNVNDVLKNPTAENILIWIWEKLMFDAHLKGIETIKIWETPTSCAELNKKGMLSIFSSNIEKYYKSVE